MRVLSLFSGLGGLDLGFMQEGFEVVLAADASVAAVKTYNRNLEPVAGAIDLATIDPRELPDADVIIGGPPCQSFSLVGQRRPDDERGELVFRFLDAIRVLRPQVFVLENVPGLEASQVEGRRLIDVLVDRFTGLGYSIAAEKLLATDYLVPQRRRRLFIIGRRDAAPVIPDPASFLRALGISWHARDISASAAIGDLGPVTAKGERARYAGPATSAIARLLRDAGDEDVSLHEMPRMSQTDRRLVDVIPPGGNYRDVPNDLATPRIMRFKETGGRTTTYGRLHPEHPAYTINTYFRRPNVGCHFHYRDARLITPREAMRFQTLPDSFELIYSSQDERNALIGNAVPALLARAIAWSLRGSTRSRATRPRVRGAQLSLAGADA